MLTLYGFPMSCSLAVHIALRAAETPFTISWVSLPSARLADGTNYAAINPRCQVPAIATAEGEVLTETPAILQYVADIVSKTPIAPPNGTMQRARLHEALNFFATEVHKQVLWQLSNIAKFPGDHHRHRAILMTFLAERLDFMAKVVEGNCFYLGDPFTVADCYAVVLLHWAARNGLDLSQWAPLAAYEKRLHAVPAVLSALEVDQAQKARLIKAGLPA